MILTTEILKKNNACKDWTKFFNKLYPNGINIFDLQELDNFINYIINCKEYIVICYNMEIEAIKKIFLRYSLNNALIYSDHKKLSIKFLSNMNNYLYPYTIDEIKKCYLETIKDLE